ncbi:hypothetical protein ASG25_12720 [Rhizobium sp. Leaf384]|nr:hypothetical protein ASG25_12720 [Rhizobium sp. Leaf384]KQS85032.1 hypothetical protein ASG58_19410 [Rhizobium sp. Leaf383]
MGKSPKTRDIEAGVPSFEETCSTLELQVGKLFHSDDRSNRAGMSVPVIDRERRYGRHFIMDGLYCGGARLSRL